MIERQGFNSILEDNEEHYYQLLNATISSIDEYSSVIIIKKPFGIQVRISPSEARLSQLILEDILSMHNLLNIKLNLSKSIKSSQTISYSIDLN